MIIFKPDAIQFGEKLGEGSFGVVYKASLIQSPNTFYAAKFVKGGTMGHISDDDFQRETDLMKKLNHQYVVQLIG